MKAGCTTFCLCAFLWVSSIHAQTVESIEVRAQRSGVTNDHLQNASANSHNWLTYSGQYNGQRFSRLDMINDQNVSQLRVKWVRQYPISEPLETSPLVVDGIMYLTLPENKVWALDAATGLPYWKYEHKLPNQLSVCCGKINRGLAIRGELLYMGTLDAKLVALDSKSGIVRWSETVGDPSNGYSIGGNVHAAPITYVADGKQYVTIAAGSALFTFGL